jgi:hypothetical protein
VEKAKRSIHACIESMQGKRWLGQLLGDPKENRRPDSQSFLIARNMLSLLAFL